MSDDHLTTEEECPDCSGFDRCDFHEGVRRGRQEIKDGESVALDDCEKSYDDYEDPLLNAVAKVLGKAEDDRLPDDTLWFSDFETLAEALVRKIREVIDEDTVEKSGVELSEEYKGLNGSEVIEKVHEEKSDFTQKGDS